MRNSSASLAGARRGMAPSAGACAVGQEGFSQELGDRHRAPGRQPGLRAEGGGDMPESVNEGLDAAVRQIELSNWIDNLARRMSK